MSKPPGVCGYEPNGDPIGPHDETGQGRCGCPPDPKMTSYYVTVMHSAPTGRIADGILSSAFVDLPGDPADPIVFDWMVGVIETGLRVQHVLPLWWVARTPA